MSHIAVENFGPIRKFSCNVARVNLLIGPQASGKSTIAKLLYYLKMLPVKLAYFAPDKRAGRNYYEQYLKVLKSDFINLFGPVFHQPDLSIVYTFAKPGASCKHSVTIAQSRVPATGKNYLDIKFDKKLRENLEILLKDIAEFRNREPQGLIGSRISRLHEDAQKDFLAKSGELFCEMRSPIFIPAGRTLMTLLSDQLKNFKSADLIMDDFFDTIRDIRPQVGHGLVEIEERARRTWPRQPDSTLAELAREEIQKILRGRYAFADGEERIYHGSDYYSAYTKLSVASSGQQESLWVILTAYMLILERVPTFAVFEEPEAHLYPESQYAIIRLMALLANADSNNQILITTHSPYVLVSLNNLLTAERVGSKNLQKVSEIIRRQFWLNIKDLAASVFSGAGDARSIIDKDLGLIKSETIDSASCIMNEEYDRMMDLDFEGVAK